MQEVSTAISHQQTLRQQSQQRDGVIQHLQVQLHAAVQQMGHMQQQAQVQASKAYKAAVAASTERLQELQDRYFHSTPADTVPAGRQSSGSLLRLQRDGIVAAYNDFQQRRGIVQSLGTVPHNAYSSPSSTLRRGTWAGGSQGALQQPWSPQPPFADTLGRALNASSRFMDSKQSFIRPVSCTSSSALPHRQGHGFQAQPLQTEQSVEAFSAAQQQQGFLDQPFKAAMLLPPSASQDSAERAVGAYHLQHDASMPLAAAPGSSSVTSDLSSAVDMSAWTLLDVQPEPGWLTPFQQQLVQFEACLLNSVTALLTQAPAAADTATGQSVGERSAWHHTPPRQQCFPKAALDSQQMSEDTTGMCNATAL